MAAPAPCPCREDQPDFGPLKGQGSLILQGRSTEGQSRWVGAQHSERKEGSQALPPTFDPPLGKNYPLQISPVTDR